MMRPRIGWLFAMMLVSALQLVAQGTPTEYFHVLSTGQSLALGMTSSPMLSTAQPYPCYSLSPHLGGSSAPLIPLVEHNDWESPSSGLANTLYTMDTASRPVMVSNHASGGSLYADLKKGTQTWAYAMTQVATAKASVDSMGQTARYRPLCVTLVHGEADNNAGNTPLYQGYLEEWQSDYESDISAIMGAPIDFPMFVSQMNTGWTGEMGIAQLNAHKANPGKIILIGPKYPYDYSDDLHLQNFESKHLGEQFGKVIGEVLLRGNTWNPLMPTQVLRLDSVITIDFHIPMGTLSLDTTLVAPRPNFGFEFVQTGGDSIGIAQVRLRPGNTQIEITLDTIPTGTNHLIRYAYTCHWGGTGYATCGDAANPTFVGGNLRDNDTRISPAIGSTGLPLYNWCVTFEAPVLDALTPLTHEKGPELRVFPNPATGDRLKISAAEPLEIAVLHDLSGRSLRQWSAPDLQDGEIELMGLAAGSYVLRVRTASGAWAMHKVVVQAPAF